MKKAIYFRFLLIIFVTGMLSGSISALTAAIREEHQVKESLIKLCKAAQYQYTVYADVPSPALSLSRGLGGERVTIIAPNGMVLEDSQSDPASMENHWNREEFQTATMDHVTISIRQSETLGQSFMYGAIQLENGNVLRLAHGYGGLMQGIFRQLPIFLMTFFLAAAASGFIAHTLTRRLLLPLEQFTDHISTGNYGAIAENSGYYELDKITNKIHGLLSELSASRQEIMTQHEKTGFILSNMREGFVLLDDQLHVALMNTSAKRILGITASAEYKNLLTLTRVPQLQEAVQEAISRRQSGTFDWNTADTVYSVHVSPVPGIYVESQNDGATVLFIDVGQERLSQQQRSEFFSNASHELKTPITTVMALSEMLEQGLLKEESKAQTYSRIHTESKRINQLLTDILTISRLESGVLSEPVEAVAVQDVVQEVCKSLEPLAQVGQVTLIQNCEFCYLYASSRRVRDLLKNLVENGIKYNKPGGTVTITVKKYNDQIEIEIQDTGAGIPQEAQSRVFERFYRVDAGRSKEIGGTGLGLAIVKHIIRSLNGSIALKSKPEEGTQIRVRLPAGSGDNKAEG